MQSWAQEPFSRLETYLYETVRLCNLSAQGIYGLKGQIFLIEALYGGEGPWSFTPEPDEGKRAIEESKQLAELAKNEIDNEFPLLHAHAIVGIWGALEACIDDLIVSVLVNDADARRHEVFVKVKVSITELEGLESEERMRIVLEEGKRLLRAEQRIGINTFESILATVDLSGDVDEDTRRDILELQQLRHVFVHRGGIADRKLSRHCPWLNVTPGTRIMPKRKDYERFARAIVNYAIAVRKRVTKKYLECEVP
jgi:hypothetical protein